MTQVLPLFPKKISLYTVLTILVVCACSGTALSENTATAEWNISANKITRLENPTRIIAEGEIILQKREKRPVAQPRKKVNSIWAEMLGEKPAAKQTVLQKQPENFKQKIETTATIKADWISYDTEKESIFAKGNISVDTGEDTLFADEATINLNTETGKLVNAKIIRKDHDLHFEGEIIEKTGTKTYYLKDGWVITCKLEKDQVPPWSFSSKEATIRHGGYAVLKHAKFNIKNVPILYSPYLIVPVKDTRQSGALLPEISYSSVSGLGFNLPIFWNLSDSADITFFSEFYTKRGIMPGIEMRYALSETSQGQMTASYLNDSLSDASETDYYKDTGYTHTNDERYWLRGKLDHTFGDGWITRVDVDIVSDLDYLKEFSSGITGFEESDEIYLDTFGRGFENKSDKLRENTISILKNWQSSALNIALLGINDVRQNSADDALWKLPSINYSGALPLSDTSFIFDWETEFVNFWREQGVSGKRLDLYPKISVPVPLGVYLESSAEVGVRHTSYSLEANDDKKWDNSNSPKRTLVTLNTDIATTMIRDFPMKKNEDINYLRHTVRPYLEYEFISDPGDDILPNFDDIDTIKKTSSITYGVDNFFNFYDFDDNKIREVGYFLIEQTYSFLDDGSDSNFSALTLKVGWNPMKKLNFSYKAKLPVTDDEDNTEHSFKADYTNGRGDTFKLQYRFDDEDEVEQINAKLKARLLPTIEVALDIKHSIADDETNKGRISIGYLQPCWSIKLVGDFTPEEERFGFIFNLANLGSPFGMNF